MKITILVFSLFLITVSNCFPFEKRDQKGDAAEEDVGENEEVSGEIEDPDSGSAGDTRGEIFSGKQENEKEQEKQRKESSKDQKGKYGKEATESERTENAEKYEDEEQVNNEKPKPVQQRSHEKKKNLMESMIDNGKLQAYSVSKGKARTKVPADDSEAANEGGEGEDENTDVDLDFKETGLDAISGSGEDDENLHLTLRQTYNKKYDDKNSPAFKILTGNFEKDMMAALGEGSEISDINFSETEVEGNPKTTGKVRANFKFTGNYEKLSKIIKTGNINGLLVVKNSLEGPMLDIKEE